VRRGGGRGTCKAADSSEEYVDGGHSKFGDGGQEELTDTQVENPVDSHC
jgi:hypothetical protein